MILISGGLININSLVYQNFILFSHTDSCVISEQYQ